LRHPEELYQKFLHLRQVKDIVVSDISDVETDLLTNWSKLPKDTISDYVFMQRFFSGMHIKLRKIIEPWFDDEETIKSAIWYPERQDAMLRGTGVYKKEAKEKAHRNDQSEKSSKTSYKKKVSNTVSMERMVSHTCFSCGKKGHLSRNCPDKKDEGNGKAVKK